MKNFLLIAITAVLLQALTACQKEELLYSCDKETNEWVKNNLAEIQQMNRNDVVKLSGEKQRGCFRAFTPEQRYNAWIDKLIQVRNIGLNSKELKHIDLLLAKMKVEWYNENIIKDAIRFAEIDEFLKEWVDNAYNVLGWSRDEVGRIVASLYDLEKKDNTIILRNSTVVGEISDGLGTGRDCECSLKSDWCWGGYTCKKDKCDEQLWCGTLFVYRCTAMCKL